MVKLHWDAVMMTVIVISLLNYLPYHQRLHHPLIQNLIFNLKLDILWQFHLIYSSIQQVFRIWDIHTLTSLQVFTDNEERPGEKRIHCMIFDEKHERLVTGEQQWHQQSLCICLCLFVCFCGRRHRRSRMHFWGSKNKKMAENGWILPFFPSD